MGVGYLSNFASFFLSGGWWASLGQRGLDVSTFVLFRVGGGQLLENGAWMFCYSFLSFLFPLCSFG